ncbi:hypothetical protein [Agaribacter flavus]|uniref:Uncharacterized protein n=1 Tax=Agaribacter flavus TaxID=1902781 RepID=A0ABV7FQ36_9ALTE
MAEKKSDLNSALQALPKERIPARDLWLGVEYAIAAEGSAKHKPTKRQSVWYESFGIAASFFIVIIVGYFSFHGSLQNDEFIAEEMSMQFERQKQTLLMSLEDSDATTSNWQQQLSELDDAAKAIKQALENDPNNRALLAMLRSVYEQQLKLIERVHTPSWQQI